MDLQFKNKSALITGSTAGIGYAIAEALATEGATVIVNGRTEERVQSAISRIREKVPHANVEGLATDLGSAAGAELTIKTYPNLDILVNNLGIFEPKPFDQISDADWLKFFEVNVMSGVRLSRHYLPQMKQQNWGRIIFISSESAVNIPVEMIHYGMTKTAQVAIARGLAELTAETAVTVNSILVGPTASEGVSVFVDQLAKEHGISKEEMEKQFFATARPSLIKRFIHTEEIAAMVAFVCSPIASAINGAALRVEGGTLRSIL